MTSTHSSITDFGIPYKSKNSFQKILSQNDTGDVFLDEKDSSGVAILMFSFIAMVCIIFISLVMMLSHL